VAEFVEDGYSGVGSGGYGVREGGDVPVGPFHWLFWQV
jgi:hypothetical protein